MENIKSPEVSELTALTNKYSRFLIEIRKRILFTVSVFAVATIVGFVFYERIIRFLIGTLTLEGVNIVFTSPFQFINLAIVCGFVVGLILVFPLIIYQLMSFLKPAMKKSEYKMLVGFFPFCLVLFFIGFAFGAFIMKWQIQIFLERSVSLGIGNILDISRLLSTVLLTSTLMGVGFQFPIILLILMRVGLVKHQELAKRRLWIYLGSFIFAIFLPPDSILADVILSLPLIIFFELTLILNSILERSHIGQEALEGA